MGISSKDEALSLTAAYRDSEEHNKMQKALTPILDNVLQQEAYTVGNVKWWKGATYATNFLWQVKPHCSFPNGYTGFLLENMTGGGGGE